MTSKAQVKKPDIDSLRRSASSVQERVVESENLLRELEDRDAARAARRAGMRGDR